MKKNIKNLTPKRTVLLLFALFFFSSIAYSQQDFTLRGRVIDGAQQPVQFVSIFLEDSQTMEIVSESITDENGNFSIESGAGEFTLIIDMIGFDLIEQNLNVSKSENLGSFVLKGEQVIALEGAVITGEKPIYKVELDKKVYDLSQDISAQGSSLSDALQNVPSVEVDSEGNLSLRGSENVRILVDGKPSGLIGISDPAQALQNLPADAVERIEVITNPSSRYEAAGTAGIINIVMKKGVRLGVHGTVSVYGGDPTTFGGSANLNYRNGKWNLFTNFGYRYAKREGSNYRENIYFDRETNDISSYRVDDGNRERTNNGYNILLGTEYFLDDKNTFTISGSFRDANNKNQSSLAYRTFDSSYSLLNEDIRNQNTKEDDYSIEGNFMFKHDFGDRAGHEFTVDARASFSREDERSNILETGMSKEDLFQRNSNFEKQDQFVINADYVHPFGEKGKFELGARGDMSIIYTDFNSKELVSSIWEEIDGYAAITDYKQNIHAAYAQYGNALGAFSFLAGMRMEYSDITVHSILNESKTKKDYTDFFPTLFLNYEFGNRDQLQASYSRRIRRPRSWDLIPYHSFSDDRNTFMGNPDLDPQYTNSIELSYITTIGKLMITPNVYYSHTTDNIRRYQSRIYGTDNFVTRPVNVGSEDRYGLDLTFTYNPFKWWRIMGSLNFFGYDTKGELREIYEEGGIEKENIVNFDGDGFSWYGRLSTNFTLPAGINMQLMGFYRGKQETAINNRKAMYFMNLSLSKDFFDKKATLAFNIQDLFDSRKMKMTNYGEDFTSNMENRWSSRAFNINFTYRFNEDPNKKKSQRSEGEGGMNDMEMDMM